MQTLLILLAALVVDRIVGDPPWLWARVPHPVALFGRGIALLERYFNRMQGAGEIQRWPGVLTILILLMASIVIGIALHHGLASLGVAGLVFEVLIVAVMLAQKSLSDHVAAVAIGLRENGLAGGRAAVAMVVGRDPEALDQGGICRAAIETLAENFSDGVVAPAFYYALFGLPGLFAYKMLNTADSMIGHKTPRYLRFGWASARLDDVANWPAARLSALLIAAGAWIAAGRRAAVTSLHVALTDHGLHRSPNSGWPESAMAGAIGAALAGPRLYAGEQVREPMQNGAGRWMLGPTDIDRALTLYAAACNVFMALVAVLAVTVLAVIGVAMG